MRARFSLLTAVLLLVVLLFQTAWLASFPVRRWLIRERMEHEVLLDLPSEDLVLLSFDDRSSIAWEEEGRELQYGGRMYDVVRTATDEEGRQLLWCVDDERETRLLSAWEGERDRHATPMERKQLRALLLHFVQEVQGSIKVTAPPFQDLEGGHGMTCTLLDGHERPLSPPPRG